MSTAIKNKSSTPARTRAAANGALPIHLADADVVIPSSAHVLDGFREWAKSDEFPERGRISFLDGEILVDMSPEEFETHVKVMGEIGYALLGLNKRLKLGELYVDGGLLTNESANLSTEPDALFATWDSLKAGRLAFIPRKGEERQYIEAVGTPDWVLEVISNSSVTKDTKRLRSAYHRSGVPEYWLVDARRDEIDFQVLVRRADDYEQSNAPRGWQVSPLFKRRFRLTRQRNRADHWDYTLEMKSHR